MTPRISATPWIIYMRHSPKPTPAFQESGELLALFGFTLTSRIFAGLLHELFNLIQDNKAVLEDKYMNAVLDTMTKGGRDSWDLLVDVARGSTPKDPLGKTLLLARNKIAFHYDADQILRGYRKHFLGEEKTTGLSFHEGRT